MEWKWGWKIVQYNKGKILSSVIRSQDGGVEYPVSKWTSGNEGSEYGPMAVFEDIKLAIYFSRVILLSNRQVSILPCRYVPSDKDYMRTPQHGTSFLSLKSFPVGTCLAEKVMVYKPM